MCTLCVFLIIIFKFLALKPTEAPTEPPTPPPPPTIPPARDGKYS